MSDKIAAATAKIIEARTEAWALANRLELPLQRRHALRIHDMLDEAVKTLATASDERRERPGEERS